MQNKQMAAQVYDLAQRVIFDPDTGNVFSSFNKHIMPLGNIRTGQIYLYRQYPLSPEGQIDMPAEHASGWTVTVPEADLEVKLGYIQQMAMYLNMGYQTNAAAAKTVTLGDTLTMITDAVIPSLAEQNATAMHLVMMAAQTLLEYRQGMAGVFELNRELERITGFVSTMPEAFVTAPIKWQQPGSPLLGSDGKVLQ
jgi:hypothetical protein